MVYKSSTSFFRPKIFTLCLLFLSIFLLLLTSNLNPKHQQHVSTDIVPRLVKNISYTPINTAQKPPKWFEFVSKKINKKKIKIGLVNVDEETSSQVHGLSPLQEKIIVHFDHVQKDMIKWEDLFPEWIDENQKWGQPTCPEIPMPDLEAYRGLDVVVARVPCGMNVESGKGVRDVFRLQVNLVVANLTIINGWKNVGNFDRTVHVVFVGLCEPMLEIFRCDDLVWDEDGVKVYEPNFRKLKQKVEMPVGSCQFASPNAVSGIKFGRKNRAQPKKPREAYVTLLHSSEKYVCGAIALAQSILLTNSTKDLILLADDSISEQSWSGLLAAGWKIKRIQRIKSPHAEKDAYNEWNYSKLRIWQLMEYDKVIFIDADLIVLQNIDAYFQYPQVSAVGNDKSIFNSGIMLVEPSECTFKTLMKKKYEIASYNGGDQGFLNEVFTWWHRWPKKLNHLKIFEENVKNNEMKHEIPEDLNAIHYLGLKPWMCYRDYDCNWDMLDHHIFASDMAHSRWWRVYDAMSVRLQGFCALTEHGDWRIKKWRGIAQNASLHDEHWSIKVSDPRQSNLI